MTDRKTPAHTHADDDETATNIALFSPETVETDLDMHQLTEAALASNASHSLGRLENDLKLLQSKWKTVEQEMTKRDERLALMKDEINATKQRNVSLEQTKKQLERDLEERQGSAIEAGIRITELESQNVELRVQLQELQDYIDGRKADWLGLNEQLRDYENTLQGLGGSLEEREAIVAAKEEENAALAADVTELERELAEMKGRHDERESSQLELQQTLDEQSRELGNLNGELVRLHKDIESLQEELEQKDESLRCLERDLKQHSQDSDSVEEVPAEEQAVTAKAQAELDAARIQIRQLETSEGLLKEELSAIKGQLDESGVAAAGNEIRVVELQAVLLESQSEQKKLEVELEAQRELVQALEQEIGKTQRDLDLPEKNADRLSAIGDGIREIDFEIDEQWSEEPARLLEEAEDMFDAAPDGEMLTPEELFPDPAELAEHVIICEDDDRGELVRYPLIRPEMTIGRSHKADIRLNSKYISREHARITVDEDGVLIEDAGSMNGFLVNSEPCTRHRLVHGDELEIGKRRLRYLDASMP